MLPYTVHPENEGRLFNREELIRFVFSVMDLSIKSNNDNTIKLTSYSEHVSGDVHIITEFYITKYDCIVSDKKMVIIEGGIHEYDERKFYPAILEASKNTMTEEYVKIIVDILIAYQELMINKDCGIRIACDYFNKEDK